MLLSGRILDSIDWLDRFQAVLVLPRNWFNLVRETVSRWNFVNSSIISSLDDHLFQIDCLGFLLGLVEIPS